RGYQLDLLGGERSPLGTRQRQDANRTSLAQHRNTEAGTKATQLLPLNKSVFGIRQHVGDMHDLTLKQGPSHCRATLQNDRHSSDVLLKVVGVAVSCHALVHAVSLAGDRALICL